MFLVGNVCEVHLEILTPSVIKGENRKEMGDANAVKVVKVHH